MPPRDWRFRITDILEFITAIQAYVAGMDYAVFEQDRRTRDAVAMRFSIIGEAANDLPPEIALAHPEIPWRQMREMRNIMVHAYFGIKTEILWTTAQSDLPPLVPMLARILVDHP